MTARRTNAGGDVAPPTISVRRQERASEWRRGERRDPLETGQAVPLPFGHMLLRAGTSFVLIERGLGGVGV